MEREGERERETEATSALEGLFGGKIQTSTHTHSSLPYRPVRGLKTADAHMRADAAVDSPTHHTGRIPHLGSMSSPLRCFPTMHCALHKAKLSTLSALIRQLFFFHLWPFPLFNLPVAVSAASGGAMVKIPARVACEGRSHGERSTTSLVEVMIATAISDHAGPQSKVTTFRWGRAWRFHANLHILIDLNANRM